MNKKPFFKIPLIKIPFFLKRDTSYHIAFIIVGLGLLIIGYVIQTNSVISNILISSGGAFIGASLGLLFGRAADKEITHEFGLLSNPQKFTTQETQIEEYSLRKKWHIYYVNKDKDIDKDLDKDRLFLASCTM